MSEERRAWEVVAEAGQRAQDVLDDLPVRRRLGERTLDRVGQRAWKRPNVAVSSRLFKLYRLADPWDPNAKSEEEASIRLGPVSLRLGTQKRAPAPHLRPKKPKGKKKPVRQGNLPPGFKPPSGVPAAKTSGGSNLPPGFKAPRGVPNAKTTKTYTPPKPPPRPQRSGEFGGAKKHRLVGKIPMRPDSKATAKPAKSAPTSSRPAPSRPAPSRPAPKAEAPAKSTWLPPGFKPPRGVPDAQKTDTWKPPTPPSRPTMPQTTTNGEFGRAKVHRVVGKLPVRPELSKKPSESAASAATPAPINRRPPMPAKTTKKRRGRFRMTPRTTTTAPVITEVSEPVVVPVQHRPEPAKKPIIPTMAGGLDDLFGFAAQEGRMRLGSKKPDPKK